MDFQAIFQEWLTALLIFLPKLFAGMGIFLITLIVAFNANKAVGRVAAYRIKSPEVVAVIKKLAKWIILIIGTIIALDQVDFNVAGFIAGLGIAGFTLGMALQDLTRNIISGMFLLYRQPFGIGDFIKVADHAGTVKMINIRDTEIQSLEGDLVIIPNYKVLENPIVNVSAGRLRRRSLVIGLGYEEDVDRAIAVFQEAIESVAGVEAEPAPMIQVLEMGESALSLTAFYWLDQKKYNPLMVHTAVLKAVNSAALVHKINLPYPTQTVLLQQSGGIQPQND
jgi:small conductance mechanosensitive channel